MTYLQRWFVLHVSSLRTACLSAFSVALLSTITFGQAPGLPPFSALDRGLYDTVKLNDGGILLTLPVRSKATLIPFSYSLVSNINVGTDSSGHMQITPGFNAQTSAGLSPVNQVGISNSNQELCPDGITKTMQHSGYFFIDGFGTEHVYKFLTTDTQACMTDDFLFDTEQGGYSLSINQNGSDPVVTDTGGRQFVGVEGGYTTVTDRNGNVLSLTPGCTSGCGTNSYTSTYTYADPTLVTPMTETLTVQNLLKTQDVHSWNDAAGNLQKFTITYSQYTQKTIFGCTAPQDPGATVQAFPSSITTPEGTYTITYEATGTGYPGDVTGRIAKIVFPSGASVQYAYTGGNHGITCPTTLGNLIVPVLTRTLTDANGNASIWKYDTTAVTNATVVTDPSGNQTVHTFSVYSNNLTGYETLTKFYQGSHTGTGLLKTNSICYNQNFTNCATAQVAPTLTQKDVYTTLAGMSQQSQSETTYDVLAGC